MYNVNKIMRNTGQKVKSSKVDIQVSASGEKSTKVDRPIYLCLDTVNQKMLSELLSLLPYLLAVQYVGDFAERHNRWEIPALISARIWLGLQQHEPEWRRMQEEGEVAVFAETVSIVSILI